MAEDGDDQIVDRRHAQSYYFDLCFFAKKSGKLTNSLTNAVRIYELRIKAEVVLTLLWAHP